MKKIISIILTLCMALSLTPMFGAAETIVKLTPLGEVNSHSQAEIINYIKSFDESDGLVGVSEKATGKGVAYSTTWTEAMKYAQVPSVRAPYSAGSLTGEYQNTALRSLNFIRYLAGLPDDVKISDEYLSIMQQGAVMLNQQFSHTPTKPDNMDKEFYDKAYKANNKGNIGFGMPDLMSTITQGYATDSGMLVPGHRNWLLNMYMQYTAFGEAGKASNMYAMDAARKNPPDFDAICYPVSNFPTDFFDTTCSWSIQLSNKKVANPNLEKVKVTLTGGGKTWNFSNQSSKDEFEIEPLSGRIYFLPKGINGIFYSGEYTVKVTGLETKDGKPAELEYMVNFFDIKPANAATPKPTATPTPTATPKPTSTPTATPKPTATPNPLAALVTINKQPTSITVTQGSISGSITMEATSSSGKITYKLKGVGNEMAKAEFKLSPTLPIGVYEYWFGVFLDGKFVMKSDVATVTVLKRDVSSGFLEILPYNRIEQGSLNSYEKVKGKPTVVVFGSSYGCTYPGISAGYKFIKNNLLEGKVNLLAFAYGMNEADARTAANSGFKADWYTLYNSGGDQMWSLLEEKSVSFPVIAYFDEKGNFIRYRTSNNALSNVKEDFEEMLDKSGVAIPAPKPPISSLVTINKQPAAITMVTEGKITESISIDASASSGKLTYSWGIAKTDDMPPTGTIAQVATPDFKLGASLKAGTYYYFCVLYVDGKEAARSNIATIQVVKAEETTATNPETANMKKGINVISYPTKTIYTVGEGFDTTGAKVVYNTGEKLNDVTANILFYTSKTVQLTGGRPFTTTGEKVVELRQQDGNVIGEYTITVSEKSTIAKQKFADVKSGAYYEAPVIWAVENGVTSGTSENTFSPNDTCTRGQVVTFLWRAKGQPEPPSSGNPFSDVKSDDYYYKAVLWAIENGITSGTSATTFSPSDTCTSGQVVTFLWRSNGNPAASGASSLAAQYGGQYYTDAVAWADSTGLLSGTGTAFAPSKNSPRADIVTYLYRNAESPAIQ